jgi:predicted  nucleic acid-binding Zn-ribbon protein
VKAELAQLIELQRTDTCIRRLGAELEAIPERRAEIDKEFEQRASEFMGAQTERDAARERRAKLETELAETRARAEHAEKSLMAATNEKEYTAAIRETDAARKHISQLETQVLELMESSEAAEARMNELEPQVVKLRAERDEKLAAFEREVAAQREELERCRRERERLLAELPKQTSAMYDRIVTRIRGGVAVAEARNGSCTACFMSLRPQVMAQIRRGEEIITCDNCNRILFYAPAAEQQAHAAS